MKRIDSTHIIIRLQDSATKRYNGDFEMDMLPIGFFGKDVKGMPSLKDGMWYCSAYGKDTYKQYIGFVMIRRIKRDPKWNDLKWSIDLTALNNDKTRGFPEIVKKGGSYDTPSNSSWLKDNFTS